MNALPPDAPPDRAAEDAVRALETAAAGTAIDMAHRLGPRLSEPVLDRMLDNLLARHPRARAAMTALPEAAVLLDPRDRGAVLRLTVGPAPRLRVAARDGAEAHAAAIRGPLASLRDLLEGRIDGDALFFRRELRVEGDTALVVALRNTLDGEDVDLIGDLAAMLGPARPLVPALRTAALRAAGTLLRARALALAPVTGRLDRLERRMARLDPGKTR